jgi:hypothetical protein
MNSKIKNKLVLIIIPLILIIIGFNIYHFLFNIYEVKIVAEPEVIFADLSSEIIIVIKPINALGWEIPFRSVSGKFKIVEGNDIVNIILKDEENGFILLRSKGIDGKVAVYVDSEYSFLPSYIEIQIFPRMV